MSRTTLLLSLMSLAARTFAECPIQFDGRVPSATQLADFDTSSSLFDPSFVFGKGLAWSQILQFPDVPQSLFDSKDCTKALEVTINNSSIFVPSATNVQNGFRRAELLIASNNGSDPSTVGKKTLHFSLMTDASQRPLNFSHEYQLVFLEDAGFSTNQIVLKTGTILDMSNTNTDPKTLTVFGNVNAVPVQTLFQTPFTDGVWHNFGFTLDFTQNTTEVFYSKDTNPLAKVAGPTQNDVSGRGQYHFGVLKKPTGNVTDVVHEGTQEPDLNEGIIYGGIFMEDSTNNCITLS